MNEGGNCFLADEDATVAFGRRLAAALTAGAVIHLHGDLGAGKTTLCRGILHGRGHVGAVKSPTYTLVEPYETAAGAVFHFDLYRLSDPEELEFLGIRDYLGSDALLLIEWPERGAGFLPPPDLALHLFAEAGGRRASWQAASPRGREIIARLGAG